MVGDQADALRAMMGDEEHAQKKSLTRIITVTSGKGGVGKTNISTNLAIGYARLGKKVVLMDADLGLANVNVVLGIIPKYNLYHLIRRQHSLSEILMQTSYGIQIIAGASGFSKIANLSHDEREAIISEMAQLADTDLIIIDTGAGVSYNVISFVAAADMSIVVTTPEPTAITDAYGILKIITTEFPDIKESPKVLVNRVRSASEGTMVANRIINISNQFLNTKVDYLGYVYEDEIVHQAVTRQRPFMELNPKSRASSCIYHIVNRLENRAVIRRGGGLNGFFSRLFRAPPMDQSIDKKVK